MIGDAVKGRIHLELGEIKKGQEKGIGVELRVHLGFLPLTGDGVIESRDNVASQGSSIDSSNGVGIKEFIRGNRGIIDHGNIEEIKYYKT